MAVSRVSRIFTRRMSSLKQPPGESGTAGGVAKDPLGYEGFLAQKKAAFARSAEYSYLNGPDRKRTTMLLGRLVWIAPFLGWLFITDKRGTKKN